jgi:hypothetical protein
MTFPQELCHAATSFVESCWALNHCRCPCGIGFALYCMGKTNGGLPSMTKAIAPGDYGKAQTVKGGVP